MWLVFAFLTAFFTSIKDVIGKKVLKKVDVYIVAWAWPSFSLPFLYLMLYFQGIPEIGPKFWMAAIASSLILTINFR